MNRNSKMPIELLRELRRMNACLERQVDEAIPALHRRVLQAAKYAASYGAKEEAAVARRISWLALPIWAGRAAAVAGIAALVILAMLRPPVQGTGTDQTGSHPFQVSLEKEGLVIEWPQNGQKVHRISRSDTPTGFTPAAVALVRGSRWVDRSPQAPGTIYFYRID